MNTARDRRFSPCLTVLAVAVFAVTGAASSWAGPTELPFKGYYGNGKLQFELIPSPDGKDIIFRKYDPDGQLNRELWMLTGTVKSKSKTENCSGNQQNGVLRCEDEVAQTISYWPYRGGVLNGEVRRVRGNTTYFAQYRDGEKDGKERQITRYSIGKGKVETSERVTNYRQGKLYGRETHIENGSVKYMVTWNNGLLDGPCLQRSEYSEKTGKCHGTEFYSGFTGVERRYNFDYEKKPKKTKKINASTAQKYPRYLEAVVQYKDGQVVKETKTRHKQDKYRAETDEKPKNAGEERRRKQREEWRKTLHDKLYDVLKLPTDLPKATARIETKMPREKVLKTGLATDSVRYYTTFMTGFIPDDRLRPLGFKRGDIVIVLDGKRLQMDELYGWKCLESESSCTATVFRDGKFVDVVINIEGTAKSPKPTEGNW